MVISDDGPQYASHEYEEFAKIWGFRHNTSSPAYPQWNGLAVRTGEEPVGKGESEWK